MYEWKRSKRNGLYCLFLEEVIMKFYLFTCEGCGKKIDVMKSEGHNTEEGLLCDACFEALEEKEEK